MLESVTADSTVLLLGQRYCQYRKLCRRSGLRYTLYLVVDLEKVRGGCEYWFSSMCRRQGKALKNRVPSDNIIGMYRESLPCTQYVHVL